MQNIQQMVAFATAARNGSFAKAARELSQTPSTIAKSIGRLESQLGVKLFHRTTRQVSLTADGQQLFEQCQRILDEVELLRSAAAGARGEPSGLLRIEAPLTYGKRVVLPVLAKLLERHPRLRWTRHGSSAHQAAHAHGQRAGHRIVLHRGLRASTAKDGGRLLGSG